MIQVYPDGTKAKTKIGGLQGMTTGVLLRDGRVQYEFSYFYEGDHKMLWLEEYELDFGEDKPGSTIGYKQKGIVDSKISCDTCGREIFNMIEIGTYCNKNRCEGIFNLIVNNQ